MAGQEIKRKHFMLFIAGGMSLILFLLLFKRATEYTSGNAFCISCHVHSHAETSWKLSVHHNTTSGVSANCVECHLPARSNGSSFIAKKVYHGIHDLYAYATKAPAEIDWASKRSVEAAKRFVYEDACLECHTNLFPADLSEQGCLQHIQYIRNQENNGCVQCHLEVGHYRENDGLIAGIEVSGDSVAIFNEPATVETFENFVEKIPGTAVSFNMIAIPGGEFKMGSQIDEPYRSWDEGPVRDVIVDDFWMAEIEVSWNEYLAFFTATSSQGRKETAIIDEEVDGIAGATPPWGVPDQGWGKGERPAITMSHYAAETYCRWLSKLTGKKYRLPTEAEWEYAARGGTQTAYFFEGSPTDFEKGGFLYRVFHKNSDTINDYVISNLNSQDKTQEPDAVMPNPFGLKNMLGNVAEFCLDFYDPIIYGKYPDGIVQNPSGPISGTEHVVRGGSYKNSPKDLRVARRDYTRTKDWLVTDPQIPKSKWWYSDVKSVGFRVVCEYDEELLKKNRNNSI
ncbi:MAG TPA: SUMF1/EgtB/PvdO family nonheme iron enzyme [Draconibacterium sp.]|nr:SUMF1/EgtB/PvdO family nonheme iron enzyme [Draconibacterium sp.]